MRRTGSLAVLGAGEAASPSLVSPDALEVLFGELGESAFTFVVIHGPPVLEAEGARTWAQHVDAMLATTHLGHPFIRLDTLALVEDAGSAA